MTTLQEEAKRNERRALVTALILIGLGLAAAVAVYIIDATVAPGFAAFTRCIFTARVGTLCPLS
jgi:hypothetical protein